MKDKLGFSKYPSINQFRGVVKSVDRENKYVFNESTNDWDYDPSRHNPTLSFSGAVKAHGTNAGVYFHKDGTFNAQKRSSSVGVGGGHFGFEEWLSSTEVSQHFTSLWTELNNVYPELAGKDFVVYMEWCGGNIQKGVAISGLPKMALVFALKVVNEEDGEYNEYINIDSFDFTNKDINLFDISLFAKYSIEIDFESPEMAVDELQDITLKVEQECPIGKYFGKQGVGEGVVWTHAKEDGTLHQFKVKGEKHGSSKVKKLVSVDIEKLNSIKSFVEYAVTESRLNQAREHTLEMEGDEYYFDRKRLGDFIRWVFGDILKEECDTLVENGLNMKDVGSGISKACKDWFFEKEREL